MEKKPLFCPACGAELKGNEEFCLSCGEKLTPPEPPEGRPEDHQEDHHEEGRRRRRDRRDKKRRRRHRKLFVILLLLLLIALGVLAFLYLPTLLKKSVIFDADNGSPVTTVEVWRGQTVGKPADPSKDNCNFLGWQLEGKDYDFNGAVTDDLLLKGIWERYYHVTFLCEGKTVKEETVIEGSRVSSFEPELESGRFDGWTLNGNFYNFSAPVRSDLTLEAAVTAEYTVIMSDNEQAVATQKLFDGDLAVRPDDPTPEEGYLFIGWTLNGAAFDFATPIHGNITLEAAYRRYIPAAGIAFTQSKITLRVGQTAQLGLVFTPEDCTETAGVRYYTHDADIATVREDGTVTGVSVGSVVLYATLGDYICSINVTVTR